MRNYLATRLADIRALSDDAFEGVVSAIVEAAQLEIIAEEWPHVITDALAQESEWSHHRVVKPKGGESPFLPEHLVWRAGTAKPDRLLAALAAQTLEANSTGVFANYRVAGRPFAEEIPKPVLLELATLGLLRLERSIMSGLPEAIRRRVQIPLLYKLFFRWILPALYGGHNFTGGRPSGASH